MDNLDPGMLQYLAKALAGQPDAQPDMQVAGAEPRTLFPPQPANPAPNPLAAGLARPFLPPSLAPQGEPSPDLLPVPLTGPYGAPAVTRDGPRSEIATPSQDQMASNDGMVPQGMHPGGMAPQGAPPQDQGEVDNPYTATLRFQHEQANLTYDRAVAMARQAAAAGRDPSPFIEAATAANKVAEQISKEGREYLKSKLPKDLPQTLHEGEALRNQQTGAWEVPIPKTDKGPTSVQEFEYAQTHPGYNDFRMEKSMIGKADRPLVDVSGQPVDPSATGDDLLKSIPPAVAEHAKAIAEIRERWPSGTEQARQPQLQQALAAAQKLDPTLNQQSYQTRQQMMNSADSGSGRINVANLANNTALFHSGSLADAITRLNNSDNTAINTAINSYPGRFAGIIPGANDKADAVKQFNVARDAVANELERSFHGVGTTAEQAVKRQIDDLNVNDSPQTQLGALKQAQDLLRGKIEANEEDYRGTMGDRHIAAWERDHKRPFSFITPEAQASGDRVRALYENVRAGKGFGTSPAPQAAAQTPVSSAPVAPQAPAQQAPAGGAQGQRLSPEDAMKLPPGTPFIGADGVSRVRH